MIVKLKDFLEHLVWGDHLEKAGPLGRFAAIVLRYVYGLGRDIVFGQLTLRSMSLVYTTLLSVVPLIAFSFSILKGLGKHKELEPLLYDLLAPLGDQGVEITDQVIALVDNVKGGVLGGISLAFFYLHRDIDGAESRGELQLRLVCIETAKLRSPIFRVLFCAADWANRYGHGLGSSCIDSEQCCRSDHTHQ